MNMSIDQVATPSTAKRIWRTWRREIIRGGVLFGVVVGAGILISRIRVNVPSSLGALGAFGDFNWTDGDAGQLFGHGRHTGDEWEYRALIKPSQHVWIRNTNGPIEVVAAEGDSVVIRVEKSWHMSDPQTVKLVPVTTERGLTVCAVWEARDSRCDADGDYHMNGVKKNDVAVRFTVELPKSVPINASTVNGALEIDGVSAPVEAGTVNGRIAVSTAAGPVQATTVNGSIEANMQSLTGGDVRLTTVNGSVVAGLPVQLNAEIDAETVNGRVETDFPVKIVGKITPRHLRGTIGSGGSALKLVTVNGSITIHEADSDPNPNPNPHPRMWTPKAPHAPHVTPPPDRP